MMLATGALSNCTQNNGEQKDRSNGKLNVVVSIIPQKSLVRAIGGEYVDVEAMVEPGASPEMYEPTPEHMALLGEANGYIAIGVPFEDVWLEKFQAANGDLRIFHQDAGVQKIASTGVHDHGKEDGEERHAIEGDVQEDAEEEEHAHGEDPHIWLSVKRMDAQANNVADALAAMDPAHETVYRANLERFLADLRALDEQMAAVLEHAPHKEFLVYHPAFGYVADDYGLTQIPIESEGKEPSPRELSELIETARAKNLDTIFAERQFNEKPAQTIAAQIDARVVLLDPLAEEWRENLIEIANALARSGE